jgi:hypothetical protein
LDSSFQEKMTLQTPPKKAKVDKKVVPKSAPAPRSSSSRRRNSSTFGLNKGVSHGIKKPKAMKV